MLVTEDEAKKLWCPEARVALVEGMSANMTAVMSPEGKGYANIFEETRCKASGCMMWRWGLNPGLGLESKNRWKGYCGLSRIPLR